MAKSTGIHFSEFEDMFRFYRDNENLKKRFGPYRHFKSIKTSAILLIRPSVFKTRKKVQISQLKIQSIGASLYLCDSCSHIPTVTASSFRENIGMFTAVFTLMDKGQWEACTSTTNPVESINRESVPKDGRQKSLSEVLTHLYQTDKIYAAKKVAASNNVSTTYRDQSPSSQEKRLKPCK